MEGFSPAFPGQHYMTMLQRKTKMVSFRLSPDEYLLLNEACERYGVSSISELARVALHQLVTNGGVEGPLEESRTASELNELRARVEQLREEIERLAGRVQRRGTSQTVKSRSAGTTAE